MNKFEEEEKRIIKVYKGRDGVGKPELYKWYNPDVHFSLFRFKSAVSSLLSSNGIDKLDAIKVLDIGCGSGQWMRILADWGVKLNNLYGIDLLRDRILQAKEIVPCMGFQIASGLMVPYKNKSIDLVSGHTVFSSILDGKIRYNLAQEMGRVCKPGGIILIYDFRISHPNNPNTTGISMSEIKKLFPGFTIKRRLLTLAPPIARKVVPLSHFIALALETFLPFLRTHGLYLIKEKK